MLGGEYRAVTADGWTAVWLPYRGGKLGMEALLPPPDSAGCALPAAAALGAMTTRLTSGQPGALTRSVSFPKVNIATQVSMKPVLTGLGMGVAFGHAADFTGLSQQACCIGLVEHAATLDVGEKGTVASAATAVGVQATAGRVLPPKVSVRPSLPDGGDRPRDRRAPVHGPGGRPLRQLISAIASLDPCRPVIACGIGNVTRRKSGGMVRHQVAGALIGGVLSLALACSGCDPTSGGAPASGAPAPGGGRFRAPRGHAGVAVAAGSRSRSPARPGSSRG